MFLGQLRVAARYKILYGLDQSFEPLDVEHTFTVISARQLYDGFVHGRA